MIPIYGRELGYTVIVISRSSPIGSVLAILVPSLLALGCVDRVSPRSHGAQDSTIARGSACFPLRATGIAPVVDDFESTTNQLPANEGRQGWWFSYDDGTGGHLRRESVQLAEGKGRALHVTSSGFTRWGSGFGVSFHPRSTLTRACAYDASTYSGISVRARGRGRVHVTLGDPASIPAALGGTCKRPSDRCHDRPGVWVNLDSDWKTVEFPFCSFLPEGWGGSLEGVDSSKLVGVHFRLEAREDVEMWLDDLAFYGVEKGAKQPSCGRPCPLDAVPHTAKIDPLFLMGPPTPGLSVHTFEQSTHGCGQLIRRYISYIPNRLEPRTQAPILIMLHGSNANAESARTFQARDRFDKLAERDGFIVIYGNAAPGSHTSPDPEFPNTGAWRQAYFDDGQVDDVQYLSQIVTDLTSRGVIDGSNPLLLAGISNGGGMVLEAARRMPNRFRGIAAFMPYDGEQPEPVPASNSKRVLIAYGIDDPGMSDGYHKTLASLPASWAAAIGISPNAISTAKRVALPNTIAEGAEYRGNNKTALATRNSQVTETDMIGANGITQLRVLVLERAGHFWPNPVADKEDWVLNRWGFRNQDFDAADMLWEFMKPAVASP